MGLVWVGPLPATSLPFLWHLLGFFILCSQAWRQQDKVSQAGCCRRRRPNHAELLDTSSSALPAGGPMRPASKLCLPLGCSSQGGEKSARDRNLFLERTLKTSRCLSPRSSLQWSFQQGAPYRLSTPYSTPGEQRSSPARASLPARGAQGHSQKKHSNTGENLSKKAHLGKLPLPPPLPRRRNELLPLAKTCPLSFPSVPRWARDSSQCCTGKRSLAEPRKRSLQPKLS